MPAVVPDVPAHRLAERHRLGLDHRDEMWEGVLHVVPPPSRSHQELAGRLLIAWSPLAGEGRSAALEVGLFDPAVAGASSYRVPDLTFYRPSVATERGVDGAADLVVEIRSPGDETLEKISYFARLGVREVLVIARDSLDVRHWVPAGPPPAGLVEAQPGPDGWHRLRTLPIAVLGGGGALRQRDPAGAVTVVWP